MARVTFIIPKSIWKFEGLLHPSLGVGYLVAVLEERGYLVSIIDGEIMGEEEFYQEVKSDQSEVIGISATVAQLSESLKTAKIIKNNSPQKTVILGGPGVNCIDPYKFLSGYFDVIVQGEAEETLPLLLERIEKGSSLRKVSNLIFKENEEIVFNGRKAPPSDLDKLPFPARYIFPLGAYLKREREFFGTASLSIITSRGCPYRCIFCDRSVSGYKFRARSAKNVVDEIEQLMEKYPFIDKIFIEDDTFTVDKKRVFEICREIQERELNIGWSALARVDGVDENILQEMKRAGCEALEFGVESGSDRILQYLKKGFNTSQTIKTFDSCHRVGIKPGAFLIVGIPQERKEDIRATIRLIRRIRPHFLGVSYLTPLPNTSLYNQTKQWISVKDFTNQDEIYDSAYRYPFEIDPKVARAQIYEAFEEMNLT